MQSSADDQREQLTKQTEAKGELSLETALGLFDDSKKYVDTSHRTNWDNYFKVYKGKRVLRNYEGIADPVIRESHTIVETLVANIAGGNVKFHFVPTNEEQSTDTEVLNEMLDYYMLCNQMGLKNQEWVRDMLLYGTGILHVTWEDGLPKIENIPLRDFFVDPTSTGMVQTITPARYAGYEYLADKNELEREEIYDATQNKWVPRYQNLEKIGLSEAEKKAANGAGKQMDKAFKDMFIGSTLGEKASENQIHVIRLYHLPTGKLVEIGNRKEFIYNQDTWCQRKEMSRQVTVELDGQEVKTTQKLDAIKPFLPFAVLRDYIDTSQFYGEGEMALLLNDAELLNDYEAMQVDNNAYQNTPMYWVDPQFADLAPEIETIPGAVYPIPRNALGALERPQLSNDLGNKQELIMQRMRRATAADEAVQGGATGNSRTTATEVSTQLQQAQMRFSTKIANLESEGYAQLALIIFKLVQIFVTKKTAQRIVGKNGVYFKDFDPWEYNGRWEAHAKLDSTIKRDMVEVGLKDQAVFESMKDNPAFNQVEVTRWWVQKKDPNMTDDQFNKLLAPPAAPAPSAEETKAQVDIERARLAASATIYDKAPALIQGQIETELGYKPDPAHLGDAHIKLLEQANKAADHLDPATTADGGVVPGMDSVINPPEASPEGMPDTQPATAPAGLAPAMA
jgi:hypothetical protein